MIKPQAVYAIKKLIDSLDVSSEIHKSCIDTIDIMTSDKANIEYKGADTLHLCHALFIITDGLSYGNWPDDNVEIHNDNNSTSDRAA